MSRCWDKLCCTTSCRIVVSSSVGGVRVVEFGTKAWSYIESSDKHHQRLRKKSSFRTCVWLEKNAVDTFQVTTRRKKLPRPSVEQRWPSLCESRSWKILTDRFAAHRQYERCRRRPDLSRTPSIQYRMFTASSSHTDALLHIRSLAHAVIRTSFRLSFSPSLPSPLPSPPAGASILQLPPFPLHSSLLLPLPSSLPLSPFLPSLHSSHAAKRPPWNQRGVP